MHISALNISSTSSPEVLDCSFETTIELFFTVNQYDKPNVSTFFHSVRVCRMHVFTARVILE